MEDWVRHQEATVSEDHPCLPGHFPGRPIVPAVVILDEVRTAIGRVRPAEQLVMIEHAKFQGFVLPGHRFRIELVMAGDDLVDFTCVSAGDDRQLATGRMRLSGGEAH